MKDDIKLTDVWACGVVHREFHCRIFAKVRREDYRVPSMEEEMAGT